MRQTTQIPARAKINWCLDVTGVRPDGYHLLDGVMQPIALKDTVLLSPGSGLRLSVEGAADLSPGEDNLILRAARALQARTGCRLGADITLHKRIPMGAGLGGGSADCAAALRGLNAFWELGLSQSELLEIAVQLGADVPFCLVDAPCRAQGIGEILTPIPCGRTFPLVLIQPCRALSTKEVFAAYHGGSIPSPDTLGVIKALAEGDLIKMDRAAGNVLEDASIPLRPAIGEAKAALSSSGALVARMTGSGSVVFGAFDSRAAAQRAWEALRKEYAVCLLTETAL